MGNGAAQPSITCPRCEMTSYNPNDIREGYCGNCHDWTRVAPRDRFAAGLAGHEAALRAMSGDALFNVQVHLLMDTLDTVDEIADPETAGRIADALAERWADAPARVAEANKAAEMFTVNLSAPELAALMAGPS